MWIGIVHGGVCAEALKVENAEAVTVKSNRKITAIFVLRGKVCVFVISVRGWVFLLLGVVLVGFLLGCGFFLAFFVFSPWGVCSKKSITALYGFLVVLFPKEYRQPMFFQTQSGFSAYFLFADSLYLRLSGVAFQVNSLYARIIQNSNNNYQKFE
jgi:hypothetical protein